MHVVLLPSWYPERAIPGQGTFFRDQALALRKIGVKVGVIYPSLWGPSTLAAGIRPDEPRRFQIVAEELHGIVEVTAKGWAIGPLRPWITTWAARRLLRAYCQRFGRPDLIHAHAALWAGVAASNLNFPYVLTEHWTGYAEGQVRFWHKPFLRQALQRARARLAVSSSLARDLEPYTDGLSVQVVPNVVRTDYFVPAERRDAPPPFRLLSVAFLGKRKRIDLVIRALAHLAHEGLDVLLEVGGDGPERGALEQLTRDLGVAEKVTFLGLLSRDGVRKAMQRAHLFVLPSDFETFGVVYIEAMACGLPVVATRCGGPEDVVTSAVGHLTPRGDARALAQAIRDIVANYEKYDPRQIRAYVERHFSSQAVAKKLLEIYEQVLAGDGSSP